jgi:hypothetical protein
MNEEGCRKIEGIMEITSKGESAEKRGDLLW